MPRTVTATACLTIASAAMAAGPDGVVEWDGVSHVDWYDRSPQCPVDGEAFEVRIQAFADDLTAVRVQVFDGQSLTFVDAANSASRGPYDVWTAQIPATASDNLGYLFELTDGANTDYFSAFGMTDDVDDASFFVLDFDTLAHAPVGATPVTGGAVFKVWSPSTAAAHVRGEFNDWSLANPMTRVGSFWVARADGAQANDMYKYFFDNNLWKPDARAKRLNPTDNLNSILIDRESYDWQVDDFSPAPIEDLVIYQLHVGSFAGKNDPFGSAPNPSGYRDVGERAAHLAELGVNAVMINPINEFPGDFSGGYNPITMWAPEWKLGTPDDLKFMIDELHAHGIAVLLDIVWNHFSGSDNFLWNYDGEQIYFDSPAIETPWGSQADFDDGNVRSYFLDSVVLMLDEYRMDGFRMDATGFMNIGAQEASGWSLMQALNDLVDRRYIDKHVIAEQLPDNPWITKPTQFGGAGFDSQYYDAFTDTLRDQIFSNAAFGDPEMFKIRDIINGGGLDLSNEKVTNYFELHDEAWPLSGGQRAVRTIDTTFPHDDEFARSRTKLAQGLVLTAPGVPAFLMGTEWLEDEGFEEAKIDWNHKSVYADVFAYYRDLVTLRADGGPLAANAFHDVHHVNDGANVLAFWRVSGEGDPTLVVVNFSNSDWGIYRIGLPESGTWVEVLNSQASEYGGTGLVNGSVDSEPIPADGLADSAEFTLARTSISVFQLEGAAGCVADANGDGELNIFDFVAFQTLFAGGDNAADCNQDAQLNVLDFVCFQQAFAAGCG